MLIDAPDMGSELTFTKILRDGKPWLLASNGRLVPVIRGGSGEGDGGEGSGEGAGDDGSGKDEDKGSDKEPTLEDLKASEAKWRALARKHEADSKVGKQAAKELEELRKAHQTESEKALDEARSEGRREAATMVAAAKIEAALTNIVPDPASIVEDLNLAKYVTDKGDVDTDAIAALKAKYEALKPTGNSDKGNKSHPDMGQGRRQGNTTPSVASGRELYEQRHKQKT